MVEARGCDCAGDVPYPVLILRRAISTIKATAGRAAAHISIEVGVVASSKLRLLHFLGRSSAVVFKHVLHIPHFHKAAKTARIMRDRCVMIRVVYCIVQRAIEVLTNEDGAVVCPFNVEQGLIEGLSRPNIGRCVAVNNQDRCAMNFDRDRHPVRCPEVLTKWHNGGER